ncbi:MAG TPA: hypothetical protein DEG74_05825 [Clostridiales bacterium]|nr:hypothetical protein [Clostridiales bacterium]HBY33262.1 hypothetical protein [Clostridiales bacterium]
MEQKYEYPASAYNVMELIMEREYYEDLGYKPFLFYIIFGVSGEELTVSREKHHVSAFPEDLEIRSLNRTEHAESIDGLIGGQIGEILKAADSNLYGQCSSAEKCVILSGSVKDDSTLEYMQNVIGIIEAFIDQGAVGVLDLLTFTLYSPAKWTERFFEKEINAQNHVMILFSEEEDGIWLHTRGLAEFGRPDIGIHGVPEEKVEDYKQAIDQMIFYSGKGLFFKGKATLHTFNGKTITVAPEFVNDFDNDDYNNAYYNVTVVEEK